MALGCQYRSCGVCAITPRQPAQRFVYDGGGRDGSGYARHDHAAAISRVIANKDFVAMPDASKADVAADVAPSSVPISERRVQHGQRPNNFVKR